MQNSDPSDTKPIRDEDDTRETIPQKSRPKIIETTQDSAPETDDAASKPRRQWLRGAIYTVIGIALVLGLAVLLGIQSGNVQGLENQALSEAVEAVIQNELGIRDLEAGRCNFARQRFEDVAKRDAEYPGLVDHLSQAYICLNATGAPTPIPTASLTPTPDGRGAEELFAEAQSLLAEQNWDQLLEILDSLRKNAPDHQPIKVDGLYFLALRSRGEQRILVEGQLEGGIFDMTRAEQFGPLDVQGDAYRLWASLYISGTSFWDVDWGQAVFYFEQIVPLVPNMWDGSYFAIDRLATAKVNYSDELILLGDFYLSVRGWCAANDAYHSANSYHSLPILIAPTAEYAAFRCELNPDATPRGEP